MGKTLRLVMVSAALASLSSMAIAASCPAGGSGPGGTFDATRARCADGLICAYNDRICTVGPLGPGACFNPTRADCLDGLVCSKGMRTCTQGGRSYCYDPARARCN